MGRLEGKSVIITGRWQRHRARGLGVLFAREGARLVIVDRAEGVKEPPSWSSMPAAPSRP